MTCIVGIERNGKVIMGGDSAGIAGYTKSIRADEKVFINGNFIFGFTSSFRMGQILRYGFTPPKRHPDMDLYEFMVTEFIDSVRTRYRNAGYLTINNSLESGGEFLVGTEGHLFSVHEDFQVGKTLAGYEAVGCGAEIGYGAVFALRQANKSLSDEDIIRVALEAASHHSAGVAAPYKILTLG